MTCPDKVLKPAPPETGTLGKARSRLRESGKWAFRVLRC